MFELSPETTTTTGKLENKPDTQASAHTSAETSDAIMIRLSVAELDALTDIVLNAPPTKLVDDEMAEHLLRKLMQLQREKLFTSPE
jgi:hypothetical protein